MGASSISPPIEARPSADLSRSRLIFAVAGMVLTLLTVAMIQIPRAVVSLNRFARYQWVTTSFLLTTTITMPLKQERFEPRMPRSKAEALRGRWNQALSRAKGLEANPQV
jgi:hypothetical protein